MNYIDDNYILNNNNYNDGDDNDNDDDNNDNNYSNYNNYSDGNYNNNYNDDILLYDNIIIGAGVSGLTCAFYLNKENKTGLILEKDKNIGGNIKTFESNELITEMGTVIVYDWYYFFNELLKDLNLDHSKIFQEIKLNELVVDSVDENLIYNIPSVNYFNPLIITYLLNVLKNNYYLNKNNISNLSDEKLGNFYKKTQSDFNTKLINSYTRGYTYPSLDNIYFDLFQPVSNRSKSKKYIPKYNFVKNVPEEIKNNIKNNFEIKNNIHIIEINKINKIVNFKDENNKITSVKYNNLICACNPKILNINIDYTYFLGIIIKCNLKNNLNVWSKENEIDVYFLNNTNKNYIVRSIVKLLKNKNIKNNFNKDNNDNYYIFYVEKMSNDVVNEQLALDSTMSFIDGNYPKETIFIQHFSESMPFNNYKSILNIINNKQKENDIYYCGQYLGHPSLETATYTGKVVADLITKNNIENIESKSKEIESFYFKDTRNMIIIISSLLLLFVFIIFIIFMKL